MPISKEKCMKTRALKGQGKALLIGLIVLYAQLILVSAWSDSLNNQLKGVWVFNDNTESISGIQTLINYSTGSQIAFNNWNINTKAGQFNTTVYPLGYNMNISNSGSNPNWNILVNTTISFWFNTTTQNAILMHKTNWYISGNFPANSCRVNGLTLVAIDVPCPTNKTVFLLVKRNDTSISVYVNGTLWGNGATSITANTSNDVSLGAGGIIGLGNLNGYLDELYIWNRSLTDAEITNLYNGGIGTFYTDLGINLVTPIDNALVIKNSNVNFNCSVLSLNPIVNISFWTNITGTWALNQTINIPSLTYANATFTIPIGANPSKWSCRACNNIALCNFATENRTIIPTELQENSITYSSQTIEGNVENFIINITLPLEETFSSAYLVYDGTSYLTSSYFDGTNWILSRTINIPFVNADTNKTFYFAINKVSNSFNSSFNNQTIKNLAIDNCSVYTNLLYNFTIRDEGNKSILNSNSTPIMNLDLRISPYGTKTPFLNYSHAYLGNETKAVCLNIPLNQSIFRADIIADYEATGYVKEFYYMDNQLLSNSTAPFNKDLYDLELTDSTSFLMKFTDINGNIMPNSIIHIYRLYVADGVFREVETSKQDGSGQSLAHLVEEDAQYYFEITLDNAHIFTTGTYTAKCMSTPCEIDLTASAQYYPFPVNWDVYNGTSFYLLQNKTTRYVTLYFTSDSPTLVNLTIGKNDNGIITLVNSSQLYATSGAIIIYIPYPYGNQTFFANIWINGHFIRTEFINFALSGRDVFGYAGVFLGFIMLLAVVLMAFTEGPFLIVIVIVTALLISVMAIVDLGWLALISIICAGGSLIYHFIRRRK